MAVPCLFREVMDGIAYMLNPIDLIVALHRGHRQITRYFRDDRAPLRFRETTILMLALIAVNPPCNTVAIARFLWHWKKLTLSPATESTRRLFVAAIQKICAFEGDGEEEDTREQKRGEEQEEDA